MTKLCRRKINRREIGKGLPRNRKLHQKYQSDACMAQFSRVGLAYVTSLCPDKDATAHFLTFLEPCPHWSFDRENGKVTRENCPCYYLKRHVLFNPSVPSRWEKSSRSVLKHWKLWDENWKIFFSNDIRGDDFYLNSWFTRALREEWFVRALNSCDI